MSEPLTKEIFRQNQISQTTIHGWPSIWFGLFFIVTILPIFLGKSRMDTSVVPYSLGMAVVMFFPLAGLVFVSRGTMDVIRDKGIQERQKRNPDSPWLWDYAWNGLYAYDRDNNLWGKAFVVAITMVIFLLPHHYIGFISSADEPIMGIWRSGLILIDIGIASVVANGIYLLIRANKYRKGYLRFSTFPFFLGKELSFYFQGGHEISAFNTITFTLHCIEERYDGKRKNLINSYQKYGDQIIYSKGEVDISNLFINFKLPDGDFETKLRKRPAVYWELEVFADMPGVDYKAFFLLPVYADSKRCKTS